MEMIYGEGRKGIVMGRSIHDLCGWKTKKRIRNGGEQSSKQIEELHLLYWKKNLFMERGRWKQ